jgi:hypothetical protein
MSELDWHDLNSSTGAVAAYDPDQEWIYVRFPDGATYVYEACPPHVWQEFTAPETSAGKYLNFTLKHKPFRKLDG